MTRMVFFVEPAALNDVGPGAEVAVTGPEGHHGAVVRRVRPGETVDLVDGQGRRANGTVASVARGEFSVDVRGLEFESRPTPEVTVVQALAKGDRSVAAVEMLTEVGVDTIVPWQADRSVMRWDGPKRAKGRQRWETTAKAAAKQSRRAWLPEIVDMCASADLPDLIARSDVAVVLHEEATDRLVDVTWPKTGSICVVVGPEGGISPAEVGALEQAGARAVRMGPSILRASTAGVVAAGVVMTGSGRWD